MALARFCARLYPADLVGRYNKLNEGLAGTLGRVRLRWVPARDKVVGV